MAQNQESIWGTINTTLEIAINVYYLIGDKGSGLKVPASYGDNPKLKEFLSMGDRDGDCLYFPESAKDYEQIKDTLCEEYAPQAVVEQETASQDLPELQNVAVDAELDADYEDEQDGFEP